MGTVQLGTTWQDLIRRKLLNKPRGQWDEKMPDGQSSIALPLIRHPLSDSMDLATVAPTDQPTTEAQPLQMPPELQRRSLTSMVDSQPPSDAIPLVRINDSLPSDKPALNPFASAQVQQLLSRATAPPQTDEMHAASQVPISSDAPPLVRQFVPTSDTSMVNPFAAPSAQTALSVPLQRIQNNQAQQQPFTSSQNIQPITLSRNADQQDSQIARQPATDISMPAWYDRVSQGIKQQMDMPSLERPAPLSSQPQQDAQQSNDASVLSVADRRSAILGDGTNQPSAANQPAAAPISERQARTDARRQQLEDQFTKLLNLENTKAVDKNGRLKSGFLSALRLGLQGLAQGGVGGGIGAALTGFVGGMVHPELDEHLKQAAEILKQRGKLGQALAIEKELSGIDELQARSEAMREKNSPEGQAAKSTKDMLGELRRRMIISGGKLNSRDQRAMELAGKLGIDTSGGGGKRGLNPQNIKPVGSDLVYVENVDGKPVAIKIYSASGMTEAEKRRQAIDIARLNEQRSRDGLEPLDFPEDSYSVDAPQTSNAPTPQPASNVAPSPVGNITPQPQPAPGSVLNLCC